MDHGTSVVFEADRIVRAQAQRLTPDGDVVVDGIAP